MIRSSPLAGTWYEGEKQLLSKQIGNAFLNKKFGPGLLPNTTSQLNDSGILKGIIVPHAGYQYSGYIAAHSYLALSNYYSKIDNIIIIGPNHRGIGNPISIYPEGGWETPFGIAEINQNLVLLAEEYFADSHLVSFDFKSQLQEHSIEIQLPFLQYLYNEIKFLPICLSDQGITITDKVTKFIQFVEDQTPNQSTVIIASSNLSHENIYPVLEHNDRKIISTIIDGNVSNFDNIRNKNKVTMCGYGSVRTLLQYKLNLPNSKLEMYGYANSRQIAGGTGYCVGYPSFGLIQTS